eukprot:CAMPEP_0177638286 /NCGR_PEP_ID=MMETSP0447-20121125/5407_1 /TAXON_ID=0 /ORGANISM="Stygamoeba regulata, Strain BSH-02190019" /LENGTH=399 /DNA_ID=CAMNT_0019140237 /DNA_START=288 /DNA_END=1483 /DNA_ORIENTATION=-
MQAPPHTHKPPTSGHPTPSPAHTTPTSRAAHPPPPAPHTTPSSSSASADASTCAQQLPPPACQPKFLRGSDVPPSTCAFHDLHPPPRAATALESLEPLFHALPPALVEELRTLPHVWLLRTLVLRVKGVSEVHWMDPHGRHTTRTQTLTYGTLGESLGEEDVCIDEITPMTLGRLLEQLHDTGKGWHGLAGSLCRFLPEFSRNGTPMSMTVQLRYSHAGVADLATLSGVVLVLGRPGKRLLLRDLAMRAAKANTLSTFYDSTLRAGGGGPAPVLPVCRVREASKQKDLLQQLHVQEGAVVVLDRLYALDDVAAFPRLVRDGACVFAGVPSRLALGGGGGGDGAECIAALNLALRAVHRRHFVVMRSPFRAQVTSWLGPTCLRQREFRWLDKTGSVLYCR